MYTIFPMSPQSIIKKHGTHLPHWTKENGIYVVTFRLSDSVPRSKLQEWEWERADIIRTAESQSRALSADERDILGKLQTERVDQYLRTGHGNCFLRHDSVASVVAKTILFFEAQRYRLFAWCIMPNHVHVIVQPFPGHSLSSILHSWKSFSAKEANRLLSRTGTFWQRESYDHLVRNREDLDRCILYVWENPEKAGYKGWKWRWKAKIGQ